MRKLKQKVLDTVASLYPNITVTDYSIPEDGAYGLEFKAPEGYRFVSNDSDTLRIESTHLMTVSESVFWRNVFNTVRDNRLESVEVAQ